MDGDADKEKKRRRSRSEEFTTPATANINSYGTEKMGAGIGRSWAVHITDFSTPALPDSKSSEAPHRKEICVRTRVLSQRWLAFFLSFTTSTRTRRLDMNAVLALSCPVRLAPAPLRLYSKRICIGRRIGFAQYASPLHFAPTRNLHLQARLCMSKHNAWQRLHVGYGGSKKFPICETGLSSRTECSRSGAT